MAKYPQAQWNMGWNYLSIPISNGVTVVVWEWLSIFNPHFILDTITYPCWDEVYIMLVKKAIVVRGLLRLIWLELLYAIFIHIVDRYKLSILDIDICTW